MMGKRNILWLLISVGLLSGLVVTGMKSGDGASTFSRIVSRISPDTAPANATGFTAKNPAEQRAYWSTRIRESGGAHAFEDIKTMEKLGNSHQIAHTFGEALYDELGTDGVGICDDTFEYGCYHGFFGRAVRARGLSVIAKFDEACRTVWGIRYSPCHHGIGHGVIAYAGSDHLIEALMTCRAISTAPTGGCMSGVFMGYNFQNFDHSDNVRVRLFDNATAQLPCASLPREFIQSCYGEQPQWWLAVLNNDVKKIGILCMQAAKEAQEACFHGVGNYAAPLAHYDVDRTIAFCSQMPGGRARAWCQEGASWVFLSQSSARGHARDVCRGLEANDEAVCVQKVLSNPFWQI